jgi:fructokinase
MIICCGEALIDFIPIRAQDGTPAYSPKPGGSPYNVALTLGRLGVRTGFMSGISEDFFGSFLKETLGSCGVDLSSSQISNRPSTLAFVSLKGDEPQYAFFDELSASRLFDPGEVTPLRPDVECLHVGSISLAGEPAASNIERLFLGEAGRRVLSIDPNVRPSVIRDEAAYRTRLSRMIGAADIVKVSCVDLDWLLPGVDPDDWARQRVAENTSLVVLTAGGDGARAFSRSRSIHQPAEAVAVVDTVGAGDAFTGGLLASLQQQGCLYREKLCTLTDEELRTALQFAARVAAVTCARAGADPPWASELSL